MDVFFVHLHAPPSKQVASPSPSGCLQLGLAKKLQLPVVKKLQIVFSNCLDFYHTPSKSGESQGKSRS